ncbi:MAG: RNA polymerase sigma factor [Terracidiphilus sp.]|nr:RNA polymerase sigma factor [Terracidiphilus sp.]
MNWETAIPAVLAGETEALAGQAACGPMEADVFGGFYARTARPLWAYLARVGGDTALADDLVQESYVRFLTADAPLDGEVAARRYLFRIATNLLRDHWRRPRTESLEGMPEEVFAAKGAGSEAALTLGPALGQMKPRERQLLWLAYAEGYSHREIAEVTGLASASVRLLLFRARRHAAKLLKEGGAA